MSRNYHNGKIYKIVNSVNFNVYIGSTIDTLCRRMASHRQSSKTGCSPFYNAMRDIGVKKFKILLIKPFFCNSKAELEAEEYKIMKEHQSNGIVLYNEYIGEISYATKEKLRKASTGKTHSNEAIDKMKRNNKHSGKGQFQIESFRFRFGSLTYDKHLNGWRFRWQVPYFEDDITKFNKFTTYYACKKLGFWKSFYLAQEKRKEIYPEWKTPQEEVIEEFGNIEVYPESEDNSQYVEIIFLD